MKAVKGLFNLRDMELQIPAGIDGAFALAHMLAFRENAVGLRVNTVDGTPITVTLSGANKIATSSSAIQWLNTQVLTVGEITGTMTVGNAITQATSSAAGVILAIEQGAETNYITIGTITVAAFNATNVVTDSTDGGTATPTAVESNLTDLGGQWVFAYISASGVNTGAFVKVVSNTAAAITTDEAMPAGSTAIIVFADEDAAFAAMDLYSGLEAGNIMKAEDATTATYVMTDNGIERRIVLADTTSNDVLITLPDIRTVNINQEIMIFGVNATSNSIDVQSYNAAQTLDGTDISSGGTPLATIDANGDYIIIRRNGLVWVTVQDGIS